MIGDLFDNPWKVLIVAVVLIVLFGSKKLPDAARSLGRSMRILKTEVGNLHLDPVDAPASVVDTPVPQSQLAAQPAAATPEPGGQQVQIAALQQQIRDLQRSAAMDVAQAGASAEAPQAQHAG